MKNLFYAVIIIFLSQNVLAQVVNINGAPTFLVLDDNDGLDSSLSPEDKRKIRLKKYLTEGFKPAMFNSDKEVFFLRYNIYEDEMEFTKDKKVYYIQKTENTKITFRTMNKTYQCLNYDSNLGYYLVHIEPSPDKMGLITKESVKFIEGKKATSNYDQDRPANFLRQKDKHYLVINQSLYKLPKKKKDFLSLFKSKDSTIKQYMKKNKLNYQKIKDLKEILYFYNTLQS